ncbi:MAG: helix-turn-helix transcriptional regulator [Clostridia bacterium]|nr:helix-turn-helix transcriptional regulator [Clostridia bacterium]
MEIPVVKQVQKVNMVFSQKGRQFVSQSRPSFGLSFCCEGQITYTMNGKKYVSRPGVAVLLPRGGAYTLHGDKTGVFPVINFQAEGLSEEEIRVIPLKNPALCLKECERLRDLFWLGASQMKIFSAFYSLLDEVLSPFERDDGLAPLLRWVEENLSDPTLSNAAMANRVGLCESALRKRFAASLHTTPKQYVLELRLNKAKELLGNTTLYVGEVAEACGFSGVYHFCRIFKEKTGVTPTDYANAHRILQI